MSNIFENAYFDKPYKTRDGRKAIYTIMSCDSHWLAIQDTSFTWEYNDNGELVTRIDNAMDIVSEWDEEIDEKKLNKLAEESFYNEGWGVTDNPLDTYIDGYKNGWKQRMNRNESKTV